MTPDQSAAVSAVLSVDGWCENLPIQNCKHCPIECLVSDSNEDIAGKAKRCLAGSCENQTANAAS